MYYLWKLARALKDVTRLPLSCKNFRFTKMPPRLTVQKTGPLQPWVTQKQPRRVNPKKEYYTEAANTKAILILSRKKESWRLSLKKGVPRTNIVFNKVCSMFLEPKEVQGYIIFIFVWILSLPIQKQKEHKQGLKMVVHI